MNTLTDTLTWVVEVRLRHGQIYSFPQTNILQIPTTPDT